MKFVNFYKIFIFSSLNLLAYLLSVIFLTATYNIKIDTSSHYSGIAALFSFITIGLIFFTTVLLIIIKKVKIDNENLDIYSIDQLEDENKKNEIEKDQSKIIQFDKDKEIENKIIIQNDIIIQSYCSDRENMDKNNPSTGPPSINIPIINEEDPLETDDSLKILMTLLLSSFIFCQILYLVELIVLSAFLNLTKRLEDKIGKKVSTNLLIIGYLFLFIFLIFYILLLIIYNKRWEKAKAKLEKLRFCKICEECIIAGCKKCTGLFETMTDEEFKQYIENKKKNLKGSNEEKEVHINDLEKYKKDLEDLNDLVNKHYRCEDELKKLNLFPIITKKKT